MVLRAGLHVEKRGATLYWRSYAGQVLEETDTSGNMIRDYVFFDKRRVAWRDSSGVHYYFDDGTGSTRAVTDSSGNVCFDADYCPYGQENDYSTSCSPTYKFAGYEYDSETVNYYAFARYYDPGLGRFLSADPLGGAVGNPQSLNRYAYVINGPESLVDPLGLFVAGPGCGYTNGYPNPCPPPPNIIGDLFFDDPSGTFLGAGVFYAIHEAAGALSAAINSYIVGNPGPLENFAFSQVEDFVLDHLASHIPKAGLLAVKVKSAEEQAEDFANNAPGGCQP